MTLLASQRHSVMAPMSGVLECKDTGSLGRTGRGDTEGVSPSVNARLECVEHHLGMDEEPTKSL